MGGGSCGCSLFDPLGLVYDVDPLAGDVGLAPLFEEGVLWLWSEGRLAMVAFCLLEAVGVTRVELVAVVICCCLNLDTVSGVPCSFDCLCFLLAGEFVTLELSVSSSSFFFFLANGCLSSLECCVYREETL